MLLVKRDIVIKLKHEVSVRDLNIITTLPFENKRHIALPYLGDYKI